MCTVGRMSEERHSESAFTWCAIQVKAEAPEAVAARQRAAAEAAAAARALVVHEKNEWQIEVVPAVPADAGPGIIVAADIGGGSHPRTILPEGLSFSHVRHEDIPIAAYRCCTVSPTDILTDVQPSHCSGMKWMGSLVNAAGAGGGGC
jgi:hypothetical protein